MEVVFFCGREGVLLLIHNKAWRWGWGWQQAWLMAGLWHGAHADGSLAQPCPSSSAAPGAGPGLGREQRTPLSVGCLPCRAGAPPAHRTRPIHCWVWMGSGTEWLRCVHDLLPLSLHTCSSLPSGTARDQVNSLSDSGDPDVWG